MPDSRSSVQNWACKAIGIAMLLLSLIAFPAAANPFTAPAQGSTGGSGLPAAHPVRAGAANPELVSAQALLHERLGNLMTAWEQNAGAGAAWAIIGAAFLYGVLHAFGPGHRKTVVFSLYLAKSAPAWEPAGTGIALAVLHGGASFLLMLALKGVQGAVSARADSIAAWLEGGAYVVLILAALALAVGAVRSLVTGRHSHGREGATLGTILITGIYPCPGAILVLVLAVSLGTLGVGIMAVIAMSLGMSVPIVAAGYLAWFGRSGVFFALKRNETLLARVSAAVELAGYLMLLAFSVYIALPFLAGLARLIAH